MSKGNVLLTGGSGFIASHILDVLLQSSYHVVVTVRSVEKGQAVVTSLPVEFQPFVLFSIVDDVACQGAFDHVLQQSVAEGRPFDYAIHTASPYQASVQDPVRDFLDPAIRGTTGLLKSIHKLAQTSPPTIKRVVLLSSSAAMLNPAKHAAVYDESFWRPVTWAEAQLPQNAYEASKVYAERAAWAFVNGSDDLETASETFNLPQGNAGRVTSFDLAVVNCTYTFGPVQRWLTRLDQVNSSNHRIRDLLMGTWKKPVDGNAERTGMPPTRPVFTWVDVRDVARAIFKAMEISGAGGRRFYVVGGHFSNGRIAGIVRNTLEAELEKKKTDLAETQKLLVADRVPPAEDTPDDLPRDVYNFDRRRATEVLSIGSYYSLEESVLDTALSLLDIESAATSRRGGA
ncbi:methylglyoxal reductase (NADPH-dependent) gre2 [Sporothrix eucalyptigena]|uniref:Methylglyoxal reductase (NADPH-dependent) gre2 n=1 Tax=Sporothrix eucalyptigena TaxID=1812306 RepID=A0ABP0CQ19_9PEZI